MRGICGRGIVACTDGRASCRPTIQPGERREICNGDDDDCDGVLDNGFDKDKDGYTTCGGDCNDRDAAIHPDAVERCDGVDNNCNGLPDDGFNIGGLCAAGIGECRREGRLHCAAGGLSSECDAKPGPPSPEVCNGRDDDCNGEKDEGLGEISCGVGVCRRSIPACVDGKNAVCAPGESSAELCGNGLDDNCDGRSDEGFADLGKSCFEGVGACRIAGKLVCSGDKLSLVCSARPGEPRAEICGNRTDDDCDGETDTDVPGLGDPCSNGLIGECAREGRMVCDAAAGRLACDAPKIQPIPEICNGKDDDCDGERDENVTNECGGCGELPGKIGASCHVEGGDECAGGKWVCAPDGSRNALCALDASASDGRACLSDVNSCTGDACAGGKCVHKPYKNGVSCDDGDSCSARDACIDGKCAGGEQLSCDDSNACTLDSCDPVEGCVRKAIGGGMINACGGCQLLDAAPGSKCSLGDKFGPCGEGRNMCEPRGTLVCVQVNFPHQEGCNTIDDDCNGMPDDGLGATSCGIGACAVTIDNCIEGNLTTCVPRDPLPETCANMGIDDDCNGIADDIASLGKECPIAIGTCILPGIRKCVGDAETPVCVPINARDAEDEDGNGVANYCDHGASAMEAAAGEVQENISGVGRQTETVSRIFDQSRTRAAMLPWSRVFDSAVINSDSPDSAILLVSGSNGGSAGLAVMRAKDASAGGALSFQVCLSGADAAPELLLDTPADGSLIATSGAGYLRYAKIASQIPSLTASSARCMLASDRIPTAAVRAWPTKSGDKDCKVERIGALGLINDAPVSFAGAAICSMPARSLLSRQRSAFGIDVFTEDGQGSFVQEFVPFAEAAGEIEGVTMTPLGDRSLFVTAFVSGKNVVGVCRPETGGWGCIKRESPEMSEPVSFVQKIGTGDAARIIMITADGAAYEVAADGIGKGGKITSAGSIDATGARGDGAVTEAISLMPDAKGELKVFLGRDRLLTAALMRSLPNVAAQVRPLPLERFEPVASSDDIFPGGKFSFGRPRAMALIPLKRFGGRDLFASFEIHGGSRPVGSMGFFFWNANEPPEGTLADLVFDGRRGSARLAFTDPTGDVLTYRATIRASHGGSLDNWIDGLEKGKLRFSVKGDASVVGMWPVEIRVEASDQGGGTSRARAVLRRDGAVESITETSGTQ